MWKLIRPVLSPRPDRRGRRAGPLVEGMEARQVLTSLLSPTSLVLLNPQPLPPGSSPTAIYYPANPGISYPPNPCYF
jgi:hypothetical protein